MDPLFGAVGERPEVRTEVTRFLFRVVAPGIPFIEYQFEEPMKPTNIVPMEESGPIIDEINKTLKSIRKKLRVGMRGGILEREWYVRCKEALSAALEHVENNIKA